MDARTFPLCLGWLDHVEIDTLPLLHLILPVSESGCFDLIASVVAFVCGPGWTKGFTCATAQKIALLSAESVGFARFFFYLESYRSSIISGEVKLEGPTRSV